MGKTEIGIVGLGRIGGGLALRARELGIRVVGLGQGGLRDELKQGGVVDAGSIAEFRNLLSPPRLVFVFVPAGSRVDEILDQLASVLDAGDVAVDGGNSYWGDSRRRHRRLADQGIRFVDLGTSGGLEGARHGGCFMVGGEHEAVTVVEPILKRLAVEGGYVHAGPPGAGHFVKLVHNGVLFGMLQAIGEGVDLLEHFEDALPVAEILRCWSNGSVVRSRLVELMEREYRERGGVGDVAPHVEDTGEVNWLVQDAMQMERPVPVISQAVMQLFASRDKDQLWARAIAMMRHGFGGHPFGEVESIREGRRKSRVGPFWQRGQ